MMENIFYVYEHWRLDTDTCFYVGKGSGRRAYSRSMRNVHWKNIVSKLERTGFAYEVRIVASGLSEKEAFNLEIDRISFWKDIVDLANQTDGGEGTSGYKKSEEEKDKIRKSKIGVKRSLEARAAMSRGQTGRKLSDEHKAKLSLANKGRKYSDEIKKRVSAGLMGRKLSEETKKKISEAHKGKTVSEDVKLAMSKRLSGVKLSEEHKKKLSESAKRRWARQKESQAS